MKTRKLRLVSALLALAMMLALLPTAAFAEDNHNCGATSADNVTWKLENGTLTISGTGKMADYGEDPETHTIYNPPWVGQKGNIKKLVVEGGVTSIGDNAFSGCANLESVDLSGASSLKIIGNHAFNSCTALESVDLSEASSLTTIKTSFPGCTGLENVVLNEGLQTIGGSAFNHCESLKSIHIPSTVTEIGSWCFEDCKNLGEVTFAEGINLGTIEGATFIRCKNLKKITIPKSVKVIKMYVNSGSKYGAFSTCSGLESVIFEPGSELETVDEYAFANCWNLTIYCSDEDTKVKEALKEKKVHRKDQALNADGYV